MEEKRIQSVSELFDCFADGSSNAIYRGVRSVEYQLMTSIGREAIVLHGPKEAKNEVLELEKSLLDSFKRHAQAHTNLNQQNEVWGEMGWMVVAQHHGLPTRLLDWSQNPLVAAFFSTEVDSTDDSAIFYVEFPDFITLENKVDPLNLSEIIQLKPPHLDPRIPAQAGVFTVHPQPAEAYTNDNITKYIIPTDLRPKLKELLSRYGVNHRTLMPGLDGIARQARWFHCSRLRSERD